jgi:hypothetical protein
VFLSSGKQNQNSGFPESIPVTEASVFRYASVCRATLLGAAFTLGLTAAYAAFGAEPDFTGTPKCWATFANEAATSDPNKPKLDLSADSAARKSYSIPALEILGFEFLLNQYNRRDVSSEYKSTLSSFNRNLHSSWFVDDDPFRTNQLGHPYAGSIYHGFARSAGLNYWEALAYTFAGSALWETAGETVPPSRNDQINTGIGGSFLGEALFRLSRLMIEHGGDVPPYGASSARRRFLRRPASIASFIATDSTRSSRAAIRPTTAACNSASAAPRKTPRAPRRHSLNATRRARIFPSITGCRESPVIRIRGLSITSTFRRLPRAPTVSKTS